MQADSHCLRLAKLTYRHEGRLRTPSVVSVKTVQSEQNARSAVLGVSERECERSSRMSRRMTCSYGHAVFCLSACSAGRALRLRQLFDRSLNLLTNPALNGGTSKNTSLPNELFCSMPFSPEMTSGIQQYTLCSQLAALNGIRGC